MAAVQSVAKNFMILYPIRTDLNQWSSKNAASNNSKNAKRANNSIKWKSLKVCGIKMVTEPREIERERTRACGRAYRIRTYRVSAIIDSGRCQAPIELYPSREAHTLT